MYVTHLSLSKSQLPVCVEYPDKTLPQNSSLVVSKKRAFDVTKFRRIRLARFLFNISKVRQQPSLRDHSFEQKLMLKILISLEFKDFG